MWLIQWSKNPAAEEVHAATGYTLDGSESPFQMRGDAGWLVVVFATTVIVRRAKPTCMVSQTTDDWQTALESNA